MDGFSSYHNNGNTRESDFSKLTQIGSSIQKISQNGMYFVIWYLNLYVLIYLIYNNSKLFYNDYVESLIITLN